MNDTETLNAILAAWAKCLKSAKRLSDLEPGESWLEPMLEDERNRDAFRNLMNSICTERGITA